MDAGIEPVADEAIAAHSREKAQSINRRAFITAAVITLVAFLFPRL